jgi:hypothetical protein
MQGSAIATSATDSMEDFVFDDLPAGKYTVAETNLAGIPLAVKDRDGSSANSTGYDFVDEKCHKVMLGNSIATSTTT